METAKLPRVWFITGASTGLGRALAELILEKDEIVVATARKPSSLDALAQRYPAERLLVLELDVTKPQQITEAFARSKAAFGRIDVVVNNAGYGDLGEVESMSEQMARTLFDTNFWGALRVAKEAVRFFREENPPGLGGRLLQMSSMLGLVGLPAAGSYVASKFAMEGISETLVAELDPVWNIKVTLLEPGWVRTRGLSKAVWSAPHPAYSNPDLPVSRLREGSFEAVWKDVKKSVEAMYRVASLPDPPLHFVLGKDAIEVTRRKIAALTEEINRYEAWSDGLEEIE